MDIKKKEKKRRLLLDATEIQKNSTIPAKSSQCNRRC
jgi:hypothetical protein